MSTSALKSILIVDDDTEVRDVLAEVLTEALDPEEYAITTARDGAEALAILPRIRHPRLVLLDLMMPRMNGWQFLGATTSMTLPVVILSAAAEVPEGFPVLRKPVSLDLLLAAIVKYCR